MRTNTSFGSLKTFFALTIIALLLASCGDSSGNRPGPGSGYPHSGVVGNDECRSSENCGTDEVCAIPLEDNEEGDRKCLKTGEDQKHSFYLEVKDITDPESEACKAPPRNNPGTNLSGVALYPVFEVGGASPSYTGFTLTDLPHIMWSDIKATDTSGNENLQRHPASMNDSGTELDFPYFTSCDDESFFEDHILAIGCGGRVILGYDPVMSLANAHSIFYNGSIVELWGWGIHPDDPSFPIALDSNAPSICDYEIEHKARWEISICQASTSEVKQGICKGIKLGDGYGGFGSFKVSGMSL